MLAALLDLLLPEPCAGCGGPTAWCASCAAALARAAAQPLGAARPDPSPPGFPTATTAAAYDGAVRGALLAHKERGRLSLTAPLGQALAAAVMQLAPSGRLVLVPIPSSRAAVRERGYDHALRLARSAARELGATATPALAVVRAVGDQAGLGAEGRAANLAGAFRVVRPVPAGWSVVVVDDVVTTGASVAEATRALTAARVAVAGAATVAATMRRRSSRDLDRVG